MKSLIYLSKLKVKGLLRRTFSKPSSAIITIGAVLFFVVIMYMVWSETGDIILPFDFMSIIFIGMSFFMVVIALLQKRSALMRQTDASYLFVGPYTQKAIMTYVALHSLVVALTYCFISYVYGICLFGGMFEMSVIDYVWMFIVGLIFNYIIFSFVDVVYVRTMKSRNGFLIRVISVVVLIAIILSVFGYYYLTEASGSLKETLLNYVLSDVFNYTPLVGWMHMALVGMHYGDISQVLLGTGLLLVVASCITWFYIANKDLDPEVVIEDAEAYEALMKKARSGHGNINLDLKVKSVKRASFKTGAMAVSSRLFLEMRKTNSFISRQELILVVLYAIIAWLGDFGFSWYSRYVSIVLLVVTMTANYNDELKHHYIYLLPDTPSRKLLAILWPTIIKVGIFVIVMNLFGLFFGPTIGELISAMIETFGYGLVFITANLVCLRVLKSRANAVAGQFIKMAVIVIALLPSIGIGLLFGILVTSYWFPVISGITSLIISTILLWASRGIVAGVEFDAD